MKRFFVVIVLSLFLIGCGGGTTPDPQPQPQPQPQPAPTGFDAIAGTYNGSFRFRDQMKDVSTSGLTTFTLDSKGKLTGTVTPDDYEGTVTFTAQLSSLTGPVSDVYDFESEIQLTTSTLGSYTAQDSGSHRAKREFYIGRAPVKNADGDFVGYVTIEGNIDKP